MKKTLRKISILCLMVFYCLGSVALAEGISSDIPEIEEVLSIYDSDETVQNCKKTLVPLYDVETARFLKFLENSFQNKSSNSSLVNLAIVRYREYKQTLRKYFNKKSPSPTGIGLEDYDTQINAYYECNEILDTYLEIAKEQMISHIKATNYQKKTTVLLEKLHAINDQLRELNLSISKMFSFFATFKNKLPGFIDKCVQG